MRRRTRTSPRTRPSVGPRIGRILWRALRIVFLLMAGAFPNMPPPPPPPPHPTEQVADAPSEEPP
jgi:hypothetical protein